MLRARYAMAIAMAIAMAGNAFAAGGAYVVDDAGIVPPGECQVESWAAFADDSGRVFTAQPSCTAAALPMVEFAVLPVRQHLDGLWSTVIGAQAKAAILPTARGRIGAGPTFGAQYDTTVDRMSRYYVNLPVTVMPTESIALNFNVGWSRDALTEEDFATWGAGAEWAITPRVMVIGEVFGRDRGRAGWQLGPRVSLFDAPIDIDLILGRNVTFTPATWFTFGVTFPFPGF